jgi:hypothetical protein
VKGFPGQVSLGGGAGRRPCRQADSVAMPLPSNRPPVSAGRPSIGADSIVLLAAMTSTSTALLIGPQDAACRGGQVARTPPAELDPCRAPRLRSARLRSGHTGRATNGGVAPICAVQERHRGARKQRFIQDARLRPGSSVGRSLGWGENQPPLTRWGASTPSSSRSQTRQEWTIVPQELQVNTTLP